MNIFLTLLLVFSFISSKGQEIVPSVTVNNKGTAVQLYYQEIFNEGDFKFGPRVGVTYHPINTTWSHFYWQTIIEYKGFFLSPLWLRSYNKSIGYQIPTTLGYKGETNIADIEVWSNYVYHARTFDLHIVISPKKQRISFKEDIN